jgi:tripartite-type tricarboxylate transporter receptor subunit TctC
MELPRRKFLHLAAGAAALPAMSRNARADTYPRRPVRIIVGLPAGTGPDIVARLVGQWLSERLGREFIVDNRPGAGTNVGTEAVIRASPDGYTLLHVTISNAINATLYDNLNFNFMRDTAPVAYIGASGFVMLVTPSFPAKSVPEFIAYAKANPGKINMASAGAGSAPHIFGELFKIKADVDLVHVPYRGNYFPDLLAGQVQVAFAPTTSTTGYIKAGTLSALAVTTSTRLDLLPNIPALNEFLPGYEASGWQGVAAPRGTPAELIDMLNTTINSALMDPKVKSRFAQLGIVPRPTTSAEFGTFIADETEKWAKVIRAANIKLD